MPYRLASDARSDLDGIWERITLEAGNEAAADRLIDALHERFYLLGNYPQAGRTRNDLRPGLRSFPIGHHIILYRIGDRETVILRVFDGRRDIPNLL